LIELYLYCERTKSLLAPLRGSGILKTFSLRAYARSYLLPPLRG
jgi:hypothetical protein